MMRESLRGETASRITDSSLPGLWRIRFTIRRIIMIKADAAVRIMPVIETLRLSKWIKLKKTIQISLNKAHQFLELIQDFIINSMS
jgi:hypothetical protein